jgi:hypothetical protein
MADRDMLRRLTALVTKQQYGLYKTFGVPAIPVRSGGSIPIVALFEKNELKSKTILMGLA